MNGSADFENIFARISDSKRYFNGFRILQLQRIANSSVFWARIWTLRVIDIFLPGFRTQTENGRADLVNKS